MSIRKFFLSKGPGSIGHSARTILKVYENLELNLTPHPTRTDLFFLTLKVRREHVKDVVKNPLFAHDENIRKDVKNADGDIAALIFAELEYEYPVLEEIAVNDPELYEEARQVVKDIVKEKLSEEYRIRDAMSSETFWYDLVKNTKVTGRTKRYMRSIGKKGANKELVNQAVASNYRSQAYYYIKNKNFKNANLACFRALSIEKNNALNWIILGNINLGQHFLSEAVRYYGKALKYTQNPAEEVHAYCSLSMAHSISGNFDEAKTALNKARKIARSKLKEIDKFERQAKSFSKYGLLDYLGSTDKFTVENIIAHAEDIFEECSSELSEKG